MFTHDSVAYTPPTQSSSSQPTLQWYHPQRDSLQGGGEVTWSIVSGKQSLTQRQQKKEDGHGLQETAEGEPPIYIDGTAVEKVECFKFLGVHITDKLKWSTHTDSVVKQAPPQEAEEIWLVTQNPDKIYRFTIESILSGCIIAWYGNCTALNHKALQMVVQSAQCITGGKLPALHDTYSN